MAATAAPEYQFLFSDLHTPKLFQAINLVPEDQMLSAATSDLKPDQIYFSGLSEGTANLRRLLGTCRFVANDWEELQRIDRIARLREREETLEPVGLRVISERYDDGNQPGISEKTLPRSRTENQDASLDFRPGLLRAGKYRGSSRQRAGKILSGVLRTCKTHDRHPAVRHAVSVHRERCGGRLSKRRRAPPDFGSIFASGGNCRRTESNGFLRKTADYLISVNRISSFARI